MEIMATTINKGFRIIVGCKPIKPIVNIPSDALKVRVRMRRERPGHAIVKFLDRIENWVLEDCGETWKLRHLCEVNGTQAVEAK